MMQWALGWLVVAAAIGVGLRYVFVGTVPAFVNYKFFLHAHSHVMLLGWVFNLLFAGLIVAFVPENRLAPYRRLFWVLQIAVAGMLVTFPMQGYALFSILFSSLHMGAAYVFVWRFVKDTRGFAHSKDTISLPWMYWAFAFLILSSLGPFALGVLKAKHLGDTQWHPLAVYFYLHFQYNGWIMFVLFGLLFQWMESAGLAFSATHARRFLHWMAFACIPAYALSALWTHPPAWVYIIGLVAALAQIIALVYFLLSIRPVSWKLPDPLARGLWLVAGIAYLLKVMLQAGSVLPAAAQLAYEQRNIVVAYLHLVFLGVVSFFLLGYFLQQKLLASSSPLMRKSLQLWVVLFVLHEVLLILQPFATAIQPWFYQAMFGVSVGMLAAIALIFIANLRFAFAKLS